MKKNLKYILFIFVIMPCMFLFCGCNQPVSIVDIVKVESNGLYDIYKVVYSDGTEEPLTIKNGENGTSVTIEDIYQATKEAKGLGDDYTFLDFVEEYLSYSAENLIQENISKSYFSTVAVYSVFPVTHSAVTQTNKMILGSGSGVIY